MNGASRFPTIDPYSLFSITIRNTWANDGRLEPPAVALADTALEDALDARVPDALVVGRDAVAADDVIVVEAEPVVAASGPPGVARPAVTMPTATTTRRSARRPSDRARVGLDCIARRLRGDRRVCPWRSRRTAACRRVRGIAGSRVPTRLPDRTSSVLAAGGRISPLPWTARRDGRAEPVAEVETWRRPRRRLPASPFGSTCRAR